MSFEQNINYHLNRYPAVKKLVKRLYQKTMCSLTTEAKSKGNIEKISPDDDSREYFFGYYDKSPWDSSNRYVLCMRARDTWSNVSPKESADILLIDTFLSVDSPNRVKKIASTNSWNVQQGCMLQWMGPDFSNRIIYNDCRDGEYVSVILQLSTGKETIIPRPIYTVSSDGKTALTLDFSRLYNLRPGYGYYNVPEKTEGISLPNSAAIWKINLEDSSIEPILTYKDVVDFQPRREMLEEGATHKVNHLMLSPNGLRFMLLHRWFVGQRKYSRLLTCDIDGDNMFVLSDDDMVSHCCWKDNDSILAFANKRDMGIGYYLMKDKTNEFQRLWKSIGYDGHPSYSPNGKYIVTDSYPNRSRMSLLKILQDDDEDDRASITIGRVFAPFKYDNDTRCDLHPRWSHDSSKICFDAVFEGHRGLYCIDISGINIPNPSLVTRKTDKCETSKIKIAYVFSSCKKTGPVQQTLNIVQNLDINLFEPYLITLQEEDCDNRLNDYLPHLYGFYRILTGQKDMLIGKTGGLNSVLKAINPDIVHTVGLFQDYAVSNMGTFKHITTVRNYVYDDYPAKYGKIEGNILAKIHLKAFRHIDKVIACSESLSELYKDRLNIELEYIRNAVDLDKYSKASKQEKNEQREKLGLSVDNRIFIYTGQIIERKNVPFLLENFTNAFSGNDSISLVILGDGPELNRLRSRYENNTQIVFRGSVSNVRDYLVASDVYISCSRSEGLPNGVLEAMATGLPVVLSDIKQHREIFSVCNDIGMIYSEGNIEEFINTLNRINNSNIEILGNNAYITAKERFDSRKMSKLYQEVYKSMIGENRKA